jgi:adenylylsulfate kinase
LSGSGKSTVASALDRALIDRSRAVYLLDGDNIRHGLCDDLGFTPEDRRENVRRIGEVGRLFVEAGLIAIVSFISPYRADRDAIRSKLAPGDFVEVWVSTPLAVCEQRDPKGLYAKARSGEIDEFTGISAPYEAPAAAEIEIDTSTLGVGESVAKVIRYLEKDWRR